MSDIDLIKDNERTKVKLENIELLMASIERRLGVIENRTVNGLTGVIITVFVAIGTAAGYISVNPKRLAAFLGLFR